MKKVFIFAVLIVLGFSSCKKDDTIEPVRDVAEQAIADDQSLEDFLSSHYYNYKDFENSSGPVEIVIDSILENDDSKTPLLEQVKKRVISVKKSDGTFVDHNLYVLIAKEGTGIHPASVDSTFVTYEGQLLNGTVFDMSNTPVWFDLSNRVVRGFREGLSEFKSGTFEVANDNTVTFNNYGQGILFFPSGLGYFNNPSGAIPSYAPLIFKINLLLVNPTDHDGDGIPTADEYDSDGDGVADDTDGDGILDYLDNDSN